VKAIATQTKSVHLYGYPNLNKRKQLQEIENSYRVHVNFLIKKLTENKKYWLDIFNNNNKSPKIRRLEKDNRCHLGSAYGQNCIDKAVTILHNHFINIRNDLYGFFLKQDDLIYLIQSFATLNACLTDNDLFQELNQLIDNTKNKARINFYQETIEVLSKYTQTEIKEMINTVKHSFLEQLKYRKLPCLKKITIQLDSRVCELQESEKIKAHYILRVKTLKRGKWIEIPLMTSANSLRRLQQYSYSKSPVLKLQGNKIKVSVSFKKKVEQKVYKDNLVGIDIGITDLMYTSEDNSYGSYSVMQKLYNETVAQKLANRRSLANKMRQYQKQLRNPLNSQKQNEYLREKIYNISRMLQGKKSLNKVKRAYYHKRDYEISQSVKQFIKENKDKKITVVLEDIDIVKYDNDKKTNQKYSMWIRGKLMKKLEEQLNWSGISYKKVDPAYTSKVCPNCNYLHKNNRNGKTFVCNVCGHKDDADRNAGINIKRRAFDKEIKEITEKYRYAKYKRHQELRNLYQKRHKKWLKEHQEKIYYRSKSEQKALAI
jgi:IS605 OrfB family transposase